ncbi:MAG: FHA domain-containing protein [Nitrospiraceae bacterium]
MPSVLQRPKIVLKLNESVLQELEMAQPELTIGRQRGNGLMIDDASVSDHHARLIKIQEVVFLEDLDSTHGTFVNDRRIHRYQLQDTDVIRIGKHRLMFVDYTSRTTGAKPRGRSERSVGIVHILSGRTDRKEYKLSKQLTLIGSQSEASIKLTGYFAPKLAATIGRHGEGYFVSAAGQEKPIRVNNTVVKGQTTLQDGDLLEIAGVKMYFSLPALRAA